MISPAYLLAQHSIHSNIRPTALPRPIKRPIIVRISRHLINIASTTSYRNRNTDDIEATLLQRTNCSRQPCIERAGSAPGGRTGGLSDQRPTGRRLAGGLLQINLCAMFDAKGQRQDALTKPHYSQLLFAGTSGPRIQPRSAPATNI